MTADGRVFSMTGYASSTGLRAGAAWSWEVRAVNGRGLDIRTRLAAGWDRLDPVVRRMAGERLTRGNVTVSLQAESAAGGVRYAVNRRQLDIYAAAIRELSRLIDLDPPRADGLLGLKGVIEPVAEGAGEALDAETERAALAGLVEALDGLVRMRGEEGARIAEVLRGLIDEVELLTEKLAASGARSPEHIRARLATQIDALLQASPALSAERLHQEVALLAVRGDIQEEIDRLRSHVRGARQLLEEGGPIGRRLDFLAQEFNREANTVCSKAVQQEITGIGLELKARIEQLREQVQNIE